ncbi:MAG: ABC transporter permease [Ruminococcus sp.]|nr:ABC transporter permease [Ruminococcus sp.]
MKSVKSLPLRNLIKRPSRSIALLILSAFLAISAFGGSVLVSSLQNGLQSLEDRLGADIIVVPSEATAHGEYESVILKGNPGHFYMDKSYLDKLKEEEAVEQISSQLFLASAKAGCCSSRVQLIGYDPQTDFSVKPWIEKSYSENLGLYDVVIGSDISINTSRTFKIFGQKLNIVAQLEKTGTELDTAVFTSGVTIENLIKAAQERNFSALKNVKPDSVVSSILMKVRDGYDIDDTVDKINLYSHRIRAIRTKSMISSVSESLGGVSGVIGVMICVVWALAIVIMAIAFSMIINERKKEFAVLRTLGASRAKLSGLVFKESFFVSVMGGVIGIAITLALVVLFADLIESSLGLPFLIPSVPTVTLYALLSLSLTVLAGAVTAAISAKRISKIDTGRLLRGDN